MDLDTIIWLILPIVCGLCAAVYAAKRDASRTDELDLRLRTLEQIAAADLDLRDRAEWVTLNLQVAEMAQAIECLREEINEQ